MMDVPTGAIVDLTTAVFVLATMFSMGLEPSVEQLLAPLKRRRLLANSLFVNVLVVPLAAYLLVRVLAVESGYAAGILLIAVRADPAPDVTDRRGTAPRSRPVP